MMASSDGIADDLRRRIHDGEFAAGMTLPDIPSLERTYRVDHPTVRRALHRLERDGVIHLTLLATVTVPRPGEPAQSAD